MEGLEGWNDGRVEGGMMEEDPLEVSCGEGKRKRERSNKRLPPESEWRKDCFEDEHDDEDEDDLRSSAENGER